MKTFKFNSKYWKYIFWLGLCLIIMGISAWFISGTWLPVPLALVIGGFVAIGVWLITQTNQDLTSPAQGFWGRRSTQTSTNAFAATMSVIVILALINFLGVRYSARLDLTDNKLFTLSPQSQKILRDLPQPVKLWIFDKNPLPQDQELLENYRREGAKFNYEYIDPNSNPGLAKNFGANERGEAYLEYGKKRKFLQKVNPEQMLSEEKITNSIEQIKSDRTFTAYFLQGHGEHPLESVKGGMSEAMKYLEQRNYTSKPLNLAERASVPNDATLVIIAGPKRALLEQEVNVLRDYLKQGGALLVMVNPLTDVKIDSLLNDWGVKLENRLAVDASDDGRLLGMGPATPIVTQYGNHPITKDFGNGISFYQLARPLNVNPVKDVTAIPLLLTNQDSWGESDMENKELTFDEKSDIRGPLVLGVALNRQVNTIANSPDPTPSPSPTESPAKTEQKAEQNLQNRSDESRLVVIGNSEFATDGMFGQQLNGDVFINSVSWLNKQDNQVLSIRPKQPNKRRINLKVQQASALAWISMIVLPLIGFGTAAFVWWRRR